MDKRGEEILAQKTWMWSIKLRGVVFRLQIQAINTWAPIKTNLTNEEQELTLLAKLLGLGNGGKIVYKEGLNKMYTLINLYSLSWVKTEPFTWKPLFEDPKTIVKESAKRKKYREQSLSRTLSTPQGLGSECFTIK